MTERLYLHVGPHKTGTTYVQGLLRVNHDILAEQGLLSPLPTLQGVKEAMQRRKVLKSGSRWKKLRATLMGWGGASAIISHEMMSSASEAEVARLIGLLEPFDVHIIYTARDLSRVAPAMWQTGLRSTNSFTWEEYSGSLRRPELADPPWGARFWQSQDAVAVLERWRAHLPLENLHVVTVPRPGSPPELLWQRFCSVLGVDPAGHDLQPPRSNPSLGTAESELLRRVNEAMDDVDFNSGVRLSRMRWMGRELETRSGMAKYTLPPDDLEWVSKRSQLVISGLRTNGYEIVGDLDELVPQPVAPELSRHPSDTNPDAVLEVAVDTIRAMAVELARQQQTPAKTRTQTGPKTPPKQRSKTWAKTRAGRSRGGA